jgi:hypothetical protein
MLQAREQSPCQGRSRCRYRDKGSHPEHASGMRARTQRQVSRPDLRETRKSPISRLAASSAVGSPDALRRQACVARISGTSTCRSIGPSKQSRALAPTRVSRPPQARLPVEAEVRVRAGRCAAPERARSSGTSPARHTHFAIKQNCAARSPGDTLATTKETGPAVACSLGSLPSGANEDTDER